MKLMLAGLFLLGASLYADDIKKDLPAGGSFHYVTKWDNITVNCTAEPVTPSVISRSCTCTQYDSQPHLGKYKFRLTLAALLSNGKIVMSPLADALDSIDECEKRRREEYKPDCSAYSIAGAD